MKAQIIPSQSHWFHINFSHDELNAVLFENKLNESFQFGILTVKFGWL